MFISDIVTMLMGRRRLALRLPRDDPSYGLMRGSDESDEMFSWSEATTELPHFSFSLEAWRGFRELGPIWEQLGQEHARDEENEAERILERLEHKPEGLKEGSRCCDGQLVWGTREATARSHDC